MRVFHRNVLCFAMLGALFCSCGGRQIGDSEGDFTEPLFLKISEIPEGGWTIVSVSPFDGSRDTLVVDKPLDNLIVMSTSHVGFLDAIGQAGVISGVSGPEYLYNPAGQEREIADVGYDSAPDYETIVSLRPDLLLTYSVSATKSPFTKRLEELGIKVLTVNEHLERHPLARASYVRLFGALTGDMTSADSVLSVVRASYTALRDSVKRSGVRPRKALLNIPYNDQWFTPSKESYLTAMIADAGGEVLGSREGQATSSVMSVEEAYTLSKEADCWINVGWCSTRDQLLGVNPVFGDILTNISSNAGQRGFDSARVVWNDNKRVNAKGGNDIWQSGVARPDIVLRDLVSVLHPEVSGTECEYYKPID